MAEIRQFTNKNQPKPQGLSQETLDGIPFVICTRCGNENFRETVKIKYVPAIVSPNGQELMVRMHNVVCEKCGLSHEKAEYQKHLQKSKEKKTAIIKNDEDCGCNKASPKINE